MDDWIPGLELSPQQPKGVTPPGGGAPPQGGKSPWKPLEIPPDLSRSGLMVGTSGFHYDDWAGAFYPPRGARPGGSSPGGGREWFPFYQMYFSYLEINHTFQREPDLAHFLELERRSRASMRFSVMVHRDVPNKGTWDAGQGRSLIDLGEFQAFEDELQGDR